MNNAGSFQLGNLVNQSAAKAILAILALVLGLSAWASPGTGLDEQMTELEQARDWEGMQARMAQASADELATEDGWLWRVTMAMMADEIDHGEALLADALEQFPNSSRLVLLESGLMLRGFNDVGAVGAMRLARRIRRGLERAVELDPESATARTGLIQYYLNAPRVAGGGAGRAEPHFDALKSMSLPDYYALRATQSAVDDDWDDAVSWMMHAFNEDPTDGRAVSLGSTLLAAGRYDEARERFAAVVAESPLHGGAWYQLGRLSVLAEAWLDEGRGAFETFLSLPRWPNDPSPAAAWWRLGQIEMLADAPALARAAFDQSLVLDPDFSPAEQALAELDG